MVFLQPSMIKVGFFLVAGSQDQVPRRTQKAESLRQRGDPLLSPREEVRHLAATAGPELGSESRRACADGYRNLPRRRPRTGSAGVWTAGLTAQSSGPGGGTQTEGLGLRTEKSFSWLRSLIVEDLNLR